MKCPVCAAERGATLLCPRCGFRDVIPEESQRAAYEESLKNARAAYESARLQREAQQRAALEPLARRAVLSAERAVRAQLLSGGLDEGLLPEKGSEALLREETAILSGLKEQLCASEAPDALSARLEREAAARFKEFFVRFSKAAQAERRQPRQAYLDDAKRYARACVQRKETELRLLAQKGGQPFLESGSPEAAKAQNAALSAALELAEQAERNGQRSEFHADRTLRSRMTQAVTLALQKSAQAAFPKNTPPQKEAYFADAAAFSEKTAQSALSSQYDALRRVYPAAVLPEETGDSCRQLSARLVSRQLARVHVHWDAGKAQPRFAQERMLQSALREDAQKEARAALLSAIEERMAQFRRAYLDRGAQEIRKFSAAAFLAAQGSRSNEDRRPLPPENGRVQALLSRCESELCALLEKESQTRHSEVVAGFSRDDAMQARLRAAAVKFFSEQDGDAFFETADDRFQSIHKRAQIIAQEALSAALTQRKAVHPRGLFPGETEKEWLDILALLELDAASSLQEGEETEEQIRTEARDQAQRALELACQKREGEALRRYRDEAEAALPALVASAYEQARNTLLRTEGTPSPTAGSPDGRAVCQRVERHYASWLEQKVFPFAPNRLTAIAGGFSRDSEVQKILKERLPADCLTGIEAFLRKGAAPSEEAVFRAAETMIDGFLKEREAEWRAKKRFLHTKESPAQFRARMLEAVKNAPGQYGDPEKLSAFLRGEYEKRAAVKVNELGYRLVEQKGGLFGLGKKEKKETFFALNDPLEKPLHPPALTRACPDGKTLLLYGRTETGEVIRYKSSLRQAAQRGDVLWTTAGEDGGVLLFGGAPAEWTAGRWTASRLTASRWTDLWRW